MLLLPLDELLASVANQTYPHWELCLANASDETEIVLELVRKYNDERILIENIENFTTQAENGLRVDVTDADN